jgi:hypothetical protein
MLKDDEIDGEFVKGGSGGICEFTVEAPFADAALRLELLFVFARPKPWRLKEWILVSVVDFCEDFRRIRSELVRCGSEQKQLAGFP